jgi:hypothetical protein
LVRQEGGFAAWFLLDIPMVHLPQCAIRIDGSNLFGNELTWGETVHFRKLEFNAIYVINLIFSPEGNDSNVVFVGIAHSGLHSRHAILKESASQDDSGSSDRESSGFPIS